MKSVRGICLRALLTVTSRGAQRASQVLNEREYAAPKIINHTAA